MRWGTPDRRGNMRRGKLKWEYIWTGGLPHLSRLPHLPGIPHLHVSSSLEGKGWCLLGLPRKISKIPQKGIRNSLNGCGTVKLALLWLVTLAIMWAYNVYCLLFFLHYDSRLVSFTDSFHYRLLGVTYGIFALWFSLNQMFVIKFSVSFDTDQVERTMAPSLPFFTCCLRQKLSGGSAIVTSGRKKPSGHGSYEPHFHEYRFWTRSLIGVRI